MSVTNDTFRRMFAIDDPLGVLTITVGHGPDRDDDALRIDVRTRLRNVVRELEDSGQRERARALSDVDSALGEALERLLDPRRPGRGRAMFAGLSNGQVEHLDVQVPFEDRVVVRDRAFVRPLVAAIDEGRPAGVLVGTRSGARILEWSLFTAAELARMDFELTDAQLADRHRGPAAPNPARGQTAASHREAFRDRVDENRYRALKEVAAAVAEFAHERRWDRLVVAGSPRVRSALVDQLGDVNGLRLVDAGETAWEDRSPGQVATEVWPLLRSVHREREAQLVERIQDLARSAGRGALGPRQVANAATLGRVAHLVFAGDAQLEGYVDEEGGLHHAVDGLAAQEGLQFTRDPWFVERLIERVLTTGGMVTRVDDPDADAQLAPHDGVAALLRW